MNTNPSELVKDEHTDVAHESKEELIEVDTVSQGTKGHPFGIAGDNGSGGYSFGR
jgi:hypothetical protein